MTVARVNDVCKYGSPDIDPDVKIDDRIVGGFTSIAWRSEYGYHGDATAFLFSNINDVERLERFPRHEEHPTQVRHDAEYGPRFYSDLQFLVFDGTEDYHQRSWEDAYRAENGGEYDSDTLVYPHGYEDSDGVRVFRANEIEVFAV